MTLVRLGTFGLIYLPVLLGAQVPVTGVVAGRVMVRADSGAPTPAQRASVAVVGGNFVARTGADGRFMLAQLPPVPLRLQVRLAGYRTTDLAVRVRPGDTVRVEVTLEPDAQLLAPVLTSAQSADAEAFATKPNVATVTMSAAAMAGVPRVGEPDVVRVVMLLPGVASRNDFSTGLNVRGGEADQNLVVLDGYPIYNPFHLGGIFSTFMDATVGGIELMTGAFPARYGGRLSSVLDVRSAEDPRTGTHASADISALGTTGRVNGAIGEGRGTWSVAARRTYADAVTSLFTDNIFPYHFQDFHGRGTWSFPRGLRVAVTAYAGEDVLDANLAEFESDSAASKANRGMWAFDWGNRVVGASVARDVGGSTTIEQRVSTSGFSTVLDLGDGAFAQRSSIRDFRLAGSVMTRGSAHDRSIGYEVATHRIRYASGSSQIGTSDFDLVQRPTSAAAWIGDLWRVSPRWLVEGGLRAEALSGRDWAGLSPRLSVKHFATPSLALTVAAGRFTQWQHSFAGDGPLRYFDIWIASDSFIPVATAWHWVGGAEKRIGTAGSVRLEGYVKQFDRVLEANWSEDPNRRGDEFLAAEGASYGLDLFARWQPRAGAGGWIAYSYGVSSRWREGVRWASAHDRRHDLDLVATWRVSKYRLGTRFGFATGSPYTPIVGEIVRRQYDPSRERWGTGDPRLPLESIGGTRNSARFPPTQRLDLDASREFKRGRTTFSPYLSVANAYNAKNVYVYLYNYSTDRPTRRAISQYPVLPSLGVRIAF